MIGVRFKKIHFGVVTGEPEALCLSRQVTIMSDAMTDFLSVNIDVLKRDKITPLE